MKKRARQGDTPSLKLFTAALENIFRELEWDSVSIIIGGKYLNHLRFADDIIVPLSTRTE